MSDDSKVPRSEAALTADHNARLEAALRIFPLVDESSRGALEHTVRSLFLERRDHLGEALSASQEWEHLCGELRARESQMSGILCDLADVPSDPVEGLRVLAEHYRRRPADAAPVEPTFRRLARNAVAGFVDGDDERYERAIESVQAACHEAYERGRRRESPSTTSQTILNTLKET